MACWHGMLYKSTAWEGSIQSVRVAFHVGLMPPSAPVAGRSVRSTGPDLMVRQEGKGQWMVRKPPRKSLDRINEICFSLAFLPVPILKVSTVDVPSLPVKAKVKGDFA